MQDNVDEGYPPSTLAGTNDPSVNYCDFISEGKEYLMIKGKRNPVNNELQNQFKYPIGVAFDEVRKYWIVCDKTASMIVWFETDTGNDKWVEHMVKDDVLKHPSAICIYKEGKSIAVLCSETERVKFSIYTYNLVKKTCCRYASYDREEFEMTHPLRGLGKSFGGNLISIENNSKKGNKLRVFKKNVGGAAFDLPDSRQPSFLATRLNTVAISDLGTQRVYLCTLDDCNFENIDFAMIKVIQTPQRYSNPNFDCSDHGFFRFVAGLQFDNNGFLLIGDAKGKTIKLFNENLEFLHRLSTNFSMPFMSSFHVNDAGEVLILSPCSKNKLVYAQLSATDVLQTSNNNNNPNKQIAKHGDGRQW